MSHTKLRLEDWIEKAREFKLRIADVISMKNGSSVDLLSLHRNVYDIVCDNNERNIVYEPEKFFSDCKVTYTHSKDLTGILDNNTFEFHLEYKDKCWYPLKNGKLPKQDKQKLFQFDHTKITDWKKFPLNTGVGFRGELIPWDVVKYQPNVFWCD